MLMLDLLSKEVSNNELRYKLFDFWRDRVKCTRKRAAERDVDEIVHGRGVTSDISFPISQGAFTQKSPQIWLFSLDIL